MSVKVMSLVWDYYPAGGGEKLVALALADEADHDGGNIYPSLRRLAARCNMSERGVRKILRHIEERTLAGVPWIELVSGGAGGRGVTRRYRIPVAQLTEAACGTRHDVPPLVAEQGGTLGPLSPVDTGNAVPPFRGEQSAAFTPKGGTNGSKTRNPSSPDPLDPSDRPDPTRVRAGDAGLAYGDIVSWLTERGTPWHFCTGDRPRQQILTWVEAGVTAADLEAALSRAAEHKSDGPIGPSYLDPVVRQVVTERTQPEAKHGTSRPRHRSQSAVDRSRDGVRRFLEQQVGHDPE